MFLSPGCGLVRPSSVHQTGQWGPVWFQGWTWLLRKNQALQIIHTQVFIVFLHRTVTVPAFNSSPGGAHSVHTEEPKHVTVKTYELTNTSWLWFCKMIHFSSSDKNRSDRLDVIRRPSADEHHHRLLGSSFIHHLRFAHSSSLRPELCVFTVSVRLWVTAAFSRTHEPHCWLTDRQTGFMLEATSSHSPSSSSSSSPGSGVSDSGCCIMYEAVKGCGTLQGVLGKRHRLFTDDSKNYPLKSSVRQTSPVLCWF